MILVLNKQKLLELLFNIDGRVCFEIIYLTDQFCFLFQYDNILSFPFPTLWFIPKIYCSIVLFISYQAIQYSLNSFLILYNSFLFHTLHQNLESLNVLLISWTSSYFRKITRAKSVSLVQLTTNIISCTFSEYVTVK